MLDTVLWEISVFNNFCMLKFRTGKFSYNPICTKNVQDKILSPEKELIRSCQSSNSRRARARVHAYRAWRRSEETVVFAATTYAKRYGGQLWERSWSVTENRKTRVVATQ